MDSHLIRLFAKVGTSDLEVDAIPSLIKRLKTADIAHLDIWVYSIVGRLREGKSTWINIMDRYLQQREKTTLPTVPSYLFQPNPSDNRFPTSHRQTGCTEGLWISKDPYVIQGKDGRHVAIFLLDTQGLFDMNSKLSVDSEMFLLTNMISSCTILNVMRRLGLDNIKFLAQFAQLASGIQSPTSSDKIFQDLIILVRDALIGDQEYGWQEGMEYSEKMTENLNQLIAVYQNLECFFMSRLADEPDNATFAMTDQTVLPDFQQNTAEFLDKLFDPSFIRAFHRKGQELTCGQYADFLANVTDLFDAGKIPKAEGMLEVMIKCELQLAVDEACKGYRRKMNQMMNTTLDDQLVVSHHQALKEACMKEIQTDVKRFVAEQSVLEAFLQKLDNLIEQEFAAMRQNNAAWQTEIRQRQAQLNAKKEEVVALNTRLDADKQQHTESMQRLHDEFQQVLQQQNVERLRLEETVQAQERLVEQHRMLDEARAKEKLRFEESLQAEKERYDRQEAALKRQLEEALAVTRDVDQQIADIRSPEQGSSFWKDLAVIVVGSIVPLVLRAFGK